MKCLYKILVLIISMVAMTQTPTQASDLPPSALLRYHIGANPSYVVGEPVVLDFVLENHSNENLWFLSWHTPFEGFEGGFFSVVCDGKEIPYTGIMAERSGEPDQDSYIYVGTTYMSANMNLDEVRVYNRALSLADIGELYRGSGGPTGAP